MVGYTETIAAIRCALWCSCTAMNKLAAKWGFETNWLFAAKRGRKDSPENYSEAAFPNFTGRRIWNRLL